MKRFIYLYIILIGITITAQQSSNRFEEADQGNGSAEGSSYQAEAMLEENQQGQIVPGNPGDPTPIDDYIPLLVIAAAGIIAYKGYKKKPMHE